MAGESPISNMDAGNSVLVLIGGSEIKKTYHVKSVEAIYEINKVPYAKVVIQDGDAAAQKFEASDEDNFLPGSEIELKSGYGPGKEQTLFKGIIVEHGISLSQYEDNSSMTLICMDKAVKMTVGRKNKIFLKKKDSDIISEIVSEAGLSADVETTNGQHEKLIQYHSTDWDFVLARADSNGLVTLVDDGKLSVKKPEFEESGLTVSHGKDMLEMDLMMDSTYQYTEVQANFWDHAKQAIENSTGSKPSANSQGNKDSGSLGDVISPKDLVQTPAPVTKDVLKAHADALYQRGHLSRIRGRVSFHGNAKPKIGKTLDVFGVSKRFVGHGYISKVRHIIEGLEWVTEVEFGLPPKTYLENNRSAFAMPAGGLLPPVHGLQIGVVKQIHDDPEGEFRVLVNIPVVDKQEGEGVWARMAHYYATKKAGYVFYPEIDDEVVLGFLDNDPTYPIILGSLYSSKIPLAAIHTPDDKNTFKAISTTDGKMRIEFEDVKKIITIITPNKHTMVFDDDKDSITIEDPVNKNKMVMDSKGILIQAQKDITIKSNANIIVEATQNIKAKATSNFEMKATAQMKAEGTAGIELKSAATAKLQGAAMTEVKGGIVKIN